MTNNFLLLLKNINKQLSQNTGLGRKVCRHEEELGQVSKQKIEERM